MIEHHLCCLAAPCHWTGPAPQMRLASPAVPRPTVHSRIMRVSPLTWCCCAPAACAGLLRRRSARLQLPGALALTLTIVFAQQNCDGPQSRSACNTALCCKVAAARNTSLLLRTCPTLRTRLVQIYKSDEVGDVIPDTSTVLYATLITWGATDDPFAFPQIEFNVVIFTRAAPGRIPAGMSAHAQGAAV